MKIRERIYNFLVKLREKMEKKQDEIIIKTIKKKIKKDNV